MEREKNKNNEKNKLNGQAQATNFEAKSVGKEKNAVKSLVRCYCDKTTAYYRNSILFVFFLTQNTYLSVSLYISTPCSSFSSCVYLKNNLDFIKSPGCGYKQSWDSDNE